MQTKSSSVSVFIIYDLFPNLFNMRAKTTSFLSRVVMTLSWRHENMRGGEGAFQGAFHARLLCEAAEFSRHVNIFPAMSRFALWGRRILCARVRVVKEQIIFIYL